MPRKRHHEDEDMRDDDEMEKDIEEEEDDDEDSDDEDDTIDLDQAEEVMENLTMDDVKEVLKENELDVSLAPKLKKHLVEVVNEGEVASMDDAWEEALERLEE